MKPPPFGKMERMKHQLVFQHEPSLSFCLDSRSKAPVCPISTDKQDLWCLPFPEIIGYVPVGPFGPF